MATFSKLPKTRKPLRVVTLVPACFADDWDDKPDEETEIGLRLVSEGDVETARAEAERRALDMHDQPGQDRIDCFNDGIVCGIVARATCKADDAREAYFTMAEDDVRRAFTPDALKMLYDEYDRMRVEHSLLSPEADDAELVELASLLMSDDAWSSVDPSTARKLKRLCHEVLSDLSPEIRT